MVDPARPRAASLGALTFGLSAEELKRAGSRVLETEQTRLRELLEGKAPSTVEGFLEPLNRILVAVRDAGLHGALLFQVHPDTETRRAGRELSEAADRFYNEFRVNTEVYRRLQAIDLAREDSATRLGVEKLLRDMRRAGVERPAPERERGLALQNHLDSLANEFNGNISSGERSVTVDHPSDLAGLPDDFVAAHPPGPDGKVRISTKYPDCYPVMSYAQDPEVRRRVLFELLNVA